MRDHFIDDGASFRVRRERHMTELERQWWREDTFDPGALRLIRWMPILPALALAWLSLVLAVIAIRGLLTVLAMILLFIGTAAAGPAGDSWFIFSGKFGCINAEAAVAATGVANLADPFSVQKAVGGRFVKMTEDEVDLEVVAAVAPARFFTSEDACLSAILAEGR